MTYFVCNNVKYDIINVIWNEDDEEDYDGDDYGYYSGHMTKSFFTMAIESDMNLYMEVNINNHTLLHLIKPIDEIEDGG